MRAISGCLTALFILANKKGRTKNQDPRTKERGANKKKNQNWVAENLEIISCARSNNQVLSNLLISNFSYFLFIICPPD